MADIGDLIVRLNLEAGGARREIASISQGFKSLAGIMSKTAKGAEQMGQSLDKLSNKKSSLKGLIERQTELNKNTKASIEVDKKAYEMRKQRLNEYLHQFDAYVRKNGSATDKMLSDREKMEKSLETMHKKIIKKESRYDKDIKALEKYKSELEKVNNEIERQNRLNSKTTRMGMSLGAFGESTTDIGRRQFEKGQFFSMNVGRYAKDLLKMAATGFIQYESAFANVSKTVNGTDAEINKLNEDIQKMSLRLPESAENIANVAARGITQRKRARKGRMIELVLYVGKNLRRYQQNQNTVGKNAS